MHTQIVYLEGEDREFLAGMGLGAYLDGACYVFAVALHRGLGWPLVGLMEGSVIRHALVRQPDGQLRDVRGVVSSEELGEPFGLKPPYQLRDVNEADFLETIYGPIPGGPLDFAQKLAEALWPDLPWRFSRHKHLKEFADGLEELSRRTGIWIRGPVPACHPVLAEGVGDEVGYVVQQMTTGLSFTIDRKLP